MTRTRRQNCAHGCVTTTVHLIGGNWKTAALYHLPPGPRHFSALQRKLPGVTQRMLTLQPRELGQAGLVHREVSPQVPPRVEYSLTELGRTPEGVLQTMFDWGEAYGEQARKTDPPQVDGAGAGRGAANWGCRLPFSSAPPSPPSCRAVTASPPPGRRRTPPA